MAESDSLLQLGIEAARDGNKEEARNLFRLLTLQDPANAQAWLWLAGVAENREERQAALERVVELDPKNEMAIKGLQALGVTPGSRPAAAAPATPLPPAPAPAPVPDDDPFGGDEDPFAELDSLSDIMADAEKPVRRNEPPPLTPIDIGAPSEGSTVPSRAGSSSRPTSAGRRASIYDDDEPTVPARRGLSPLLGILIGLVAVVLIGFLIVFFVMGRDDNPPSVADQPTVAAPGAETAAAGSQATSVLGGEGNTATSEPSAATEPTGAPTAEPTAAPTAAPTVDLAQANPIIVPANTPLQSEGWLYDFNQPTYAAPIIGPLGQYQPNNGRFVVVLAFAVNNTGTGQTIPADFFVLKDAQGRIWSARPEVSDAYVIPGVNADQSHTQPLSPDGITRSVALIFDVAPDATNLVFFARSNPTQGWLVLPNV